MRRFMEALLEAVATAGAESQNRDTYERTELSPPRRAPEWSPDSEDTLSDRVPPLPR